MNATSESLARTTRVMWMIAAIAAVAAMAIHLWRALPNGLAWSHLVSQFGILTLAIAGLVGPQRVLAYRIIMPLAVILIVAGAVLLVLG